MKNFFLLSTLILSLPSLTAGEESVSRIVFASCCHESKPAPIFQTIIDFKPELFVWMGDNIYGDSPDVDVLRKKYAIQKNRPEYQTLMAKCPIIGTWDDHDFGANDVGEKYPSKEQSQQAYLDFFNEPANSPRRTQKGIYTHKDYGTGKKSVRVFLLDTRYFRQDPGPQADILGADQWNWLEKNLLDSPAAVNIIVSSIQVIPEEHRFEKWANFPTSRERLFKLLANPKCPPVVLCSGDRHLAEISQLPSTTSGYPLFEITSSAINRSGGGNPKEINRHRQGAVFTSSNFGSFVIDWEKSPVTITASVHDQTGQPVRTAVISVAPRKSS